MFRCVVAALLLAGLSLPAGAMTLASSARQLSPGSWRLSAFYEGFQGRHLNFRLGSSGTCNFNNPGAGTNIFFPCSPSGGDVPARADGGAAVVQLAAQPWDGLQYFASVGVGDLSMGVANNYLSGERPGYVYGLGAKAVVIPDTVVNPAVALDGRVGWRTYFFNGLQPAGTPAAAAVDQRLDIQEYQLGLEVSHRFAKPAGEAPAGGARAAAAALGRIGLEPYGGVKWLRSHAFLKDAQDGRRISGIQDSFSPFLGLLLPVYEREGLFTEVSFVNGTYYSAGLVVRFK